MYSLRPARMARQILADVGILLWVLLWIRLGDRAEESIDALRGPADQLASAGGQLETGMRDAAATTSGLPLVGEQLSQPFRSLGQTAQTVRLTGTDLSLSLERIGTWVGLLVTVLPIAIVGVLWLTVRVRFVRRARAAQRFIDAQADLDLFALRAMARQPMERLARVTDDPAGAWRRGDGPLIIELAQLELRDCGLDAHRVR